MRIQLSLIPVLGLALGCPGQGPATTPPGDALVKQSLANELRSFQDTAHPMSYRLRKSSPRFTSTKQLYETQDGIVARLIAINDKPLSPEEERKEQARLNSLLNDSGKQRHRKQAQDEDAQRALKVLRALPNAFIYQFAQSGTGPTGPVEKFSFRPNPAFNPPDLETEALTAMSGEIWIDAKRQRVAHLEGHLDEDVDVGWGIVARLNKGGWILIEQGDVGDHQWRIMHFKMNMSGRVIFKSKTFDTTEDQSQFTPLPVGLSYREAIQRMRIDTETSARNSR